MRLITVSMRLLLLGVLGFYTATAYSQGASGFDPQFVLSSDPDVVVLAYSETPDMISNADTTPLLRVYADGRVRVHYPHYMTRAGDYEVYLKRGELMQLLRAAAVVIDFDTNAVKAAKQQARAQNRSAGGTVTARSDEVAERFDIDLAGYNENPSAKQRAVRQHIEWRGIRADSREYPSVGKLRQLERAQAMLHDILDRKDLSKLPKSANNASNNKI